jgi:PAS domain S-box-containing protein
MQKQADPRISDQTKLRQKAEALLKETQNKNKSLEFDIQKEIQELQVHQIELELQNEELIQARDRAELAEKKYIELYESAPSGYLTLSREGDILELNDSAASMIHKDRSELINNRFAVFISEETIDIFAHFFDKVLKSNKKESCEVVLKRSGNAPVYINIDAICSKNKEFCLLTIVDITKRKEAEKSMLQLKVANEAIEFKQNFLANISHEMRTPLTGILGMIDILEHTELTKTQKDYLNTLKHSSENLKEIINQVLDYSKIEAGKVKLKPNLFSLKELLAETKILYKGSVLPKVNFSIKSDPKIPDLIFADGSRIRQIINNLVSNALKFTEKGSVVLSSHLLSPNPLSKQVMIKVAVTDTGIGIPEGLRDKLFVPFSQIDNKDSRKHEGTGLGLSICKELVLLLRGEIGVATEYQKGSTFWFVFPALLKDAKIPIPKKQPGHSSINNIINHKQNLNILFAEDKKTNQKVISLILSSMGHKVTIASNGEQAISIFKPGKFDLILMDIQMPVMDGITATKKLKENFEYLPPIVGLSANAFEGDREKYMVLGMDEYLTKPFNTDEFVELMTKLRN